MCDARLLLTIPDAAALLSLSRSKLYEFIARRELRTVHVGRSVRIARAELERFVNELQAKRECG